MSRKSLFLGALLCSLLVIASCDKLPKSGEDDTNKETQVTPEKPDDKNEPTAELQPSEQKIKLQEVGQEIMDMCPASEFETLSAIAEDFSESIYASEDYDWGTVSDWFDTELDEAYTSDENISISDGTHSSEWIADVLILMTNHTGLFTFTENGVTISDYNGGTKAIFTLNGKKYEAEIRSEGKVTNAIYVYTDEGSYTNEGYYDEYGNWVEESITNKYKDVVNITVGVPEKIHAAVTENGTALMAVTAEFTPSFSKEGIDLTTDSFATKITAEINGYEMVIERVAYNGSTGKAEFSKTFKKDGIVIMSTKVSADAVIETITESYEWGSENECYEEYTFITVNKAQNITASIDILGQIQVYGTCSNAIEASEELEAMWNALYGYTVNESDAQRHLNNFNAKLDLGVYYDGGNNRQATVEFELAHYVDDCGWEDYDLIPVIVFNDGSRYKLEEYFTESSFGSFIESFEAFCDSFAEVIGYEEELIVYEPEIVYPEEYN